MGDSIWLCLVNEELSGRQDIESDETIGLTSTPTVRDHEDEFESLPQEIKGRPSDTLIIFDWDDTLLCSSAINCQHWTQMQLDLLTRTVESTLRTAMQLGEVMIVTNGVDWWVDDSCRRFLPGLLPILGEIKVKSARADYEPIYPGDPFAWKRECFVDILRPRPEATNLVVLGDSLSEIHAARGSLSCMVESSLVKTVKFKETPTVNELVGQLRRVSQELSTVVNQEQHSSADLERRLLPAQFDHMAGWASGWRLSEDLDIEKLFSSVKVSSRFLVDCGNAGTDFSKGMNLISAVPAFGA